MRISAWTGLAKNTTTTRKLPIFVDGKDPVLGTLNSADLAAVYTPVAVTLGAGATSLSASGRSAILLTGDAGGNSVSSISGGVQGQTLIIEFQDSLVNITNAAAKLMLNEAFYGKQFDTLTLFYDGTRWEEIGRNRHVGTVTAQTLGAGATAIDVTSVPAIGGVKKIRLTGDAGANTINSITGLVNGESLEIAFVDALVTISTTAAKLLGNVNYVSAAHDTMVLTYDGTNVREVSRQQQTGLNGVLGAQTARAATVTTLTATTGVQSAGVARTATADGLTTAVIAAGTRMVDVTSGNSTHLITLPAPVVGNIIDLYVGANGFRLQTNDPATVGLNNTTGGGTYLQIAANSRVIAACVTATNWVVAIITNTGELTLTSATASVGVQCTPVARTATADGTGTGTIAPGTREVAVTSADANHIIILPAPVVGNVINLHVGATGYELRTSNPATISLNNVTGAGVELAVAANTHIQARCVSATAWIATKFDNVGAPAGGGTPDA